MWPRTLQMTKEECRGTLRRLELESYAQVISVFRAQGGLNDVKTKVLQELRGVFHISVERHRAEARRVANDEQLTTIADMISGPNTWQDWSREGRRPFPLLPRVTPQTALSFIADKIASEVANENAKLPHPEDTEVTRKNKDNSISQDDIVIISEPERSLNVVTSDPFKIPDISTTVKKHLKRSLTDGPIVPTKKRATDIKNENNPDQYLPVEEIFDKNLITTSSNNIRKLYLSHNNKLHQHSLTKKGQKLPKQKNPKKNLGLLTAKRKTLQTKGTRRYKKLSQKALEQQQENLQEQNIQIFDAEQSKQTCNTYLSGFSENTIGEVKDPEMLLDHRKSMHSQLQSFVPQVSVSNKDVSKNTAKLQTGALSLPEPMRFTSFEQVGNSPAIQLAGLKLPRAEKQLISSPVQKYIVEDRQPTSASLTNSEIFAMPQFSAAPTKLRNSNLSTSCNSKKVSSLAQNAFAATIVQTPHKVNGQPTSIPDDNISSTSNALSLQKPNEGNVTTGSSFEVPTTPILAPPHTPPTVIQLHNNTSEAIIQPSQSKVLTTKLVPIVINNTANGAGNNNSESKSKVEPSNNGSTILASTNRPPTPTIIKGLSPSVLLPGRSGCVTSDKGNTLFSTLGSSGAVFRKSPNILKTTNIINKPASGTVLSSASVLSPKVCSSASSIPFTTGAIFSNLKLTPALQSAPGINTSNVFQNQLKGVPNKSVKICQSATGKVFIQPAHPELTNTKLSGTAAQKFISSTLTGTTPNRQTELLSSSSQPTQRIAIQKVQIIPAPLSANNLLQQQQPNSQKLTSLTFGQKGSMIFMPSSANRQSTGAFTFTKSNTDKNQLQVTGADNTKANVVVIGASSMPIKSSTTSQITNTKVSTVSAVGLQQPQDPALDILNMPIIVDNTGSVPSHSSNELIAMPEKINPTVSDRAFNASETQPRQEKPLIYGVTDWEMELDQATAVAAATKANFPQTTTDTQSEYVIKSRQHKSLPKETLLDENIDVIVEEQLPAHWEKVEEQSEPQRKKPATTSYILAKRTFTKVIEKQRRRPEEEEEILDEFSQSGT